MGSLAWLIRPIAHRGLHDAGSGIIENTATAFQAAIDAGYAIETDVQASGDGEVMVFHDDTLDRLTTASGPFTAHDAVALKKIPFRATGDRMQTLSELLEQIGGRVPLVIEVKSDWNARGPVERRIADILGAYKGDTAVMSFDPHAVAAFAAAAPSHPRGLVAGRFRSDHYWSHLSWWRRFTMRHLLSAAVAGPHFIAYDIRGLPSLAPVAARKMFGLPLLTWTVRTVADRKTAQAWADAMIFEGFRPDHAGKASWVKLNRS